jgi:holdfast attachment protein HfaA
MRQGKSASLPHHAPAAVAAAALVVLGLATPAAAQSMGGSGSQFNGGYAGSNLNRAVDVSTRDDNNNQVFINGRLNAPNGSVFSDAQGVSRSATGVGGGGYATAIGNNLNVIVQGSWNRVVVDSTQINNGDVSAQTSLNGALNLQ